MEEILEQLRKFRSHRYKILAAPADTIIGDIVEHTFKNIQRYFQKTRSRKDNYQNHMNLDLDWDWNCRCSNDEPPWYYSFIAHSMEQDTHRKERDERRRKNRVKEEKRGEVRKGFRPNGVGDHGSCRYWSGSVGLSHVTDQVILENPSRMEL